MTVGRRREGLLEPRRWGSCCELCIQSRRKCRGELGTHLRRTVGRREQPRQLAFVDVAEKFVAEKFVVGMLFAVCHVALRSCAWFGARRCFNSKRWRKPRRAR